MTKKIVNILLGIFLGVGFLIITFKDKSLTDIFSSIKEADLHWIAVNGFCLLLTFFLRSYRWKILIENAGSGSKIKNVFYSVIMGYTINSFTPKLGEIARCLSLKETDGVKTSVSLGTVVTERIYDLLILGFGLMVFFLLEVDKLWFLFRKTFAGNGIFNIDSAYKFISILALFIVVTLVLYYFIRRKKIFLKLKIFIAEIWSTVIKSFKIKKIKLFTLLTICIWVVLAFMNYSCLKALPSTENFSFYFATIILFIAGIGWAIPSPGGIGTTHFFILQLFIAFSLDENSGLAFGVLSNGLTLIFTWIIGLSAMFISIVTRFVNRKRLKI